MDKQLKQRLVGAIVLVSLGVIFIPALLDGSGYKSRHARSIEIPEEPKFAPLTQLEVEKIKTPIEVRKEQPKKKIKSKKIATTKNVIKKKKVEPIQTWALQVGTFGQESNALVLQDKLRADKHPAYVTQIKVDGREKFKVRIGPVVDKQRVEKLKDSIKKAHNLDGYIVRHP